MRISQVEDPSSIGFSIAVNGPAYVMNSYIFEFQKIEISSSGIGLLNIHQILTLHRT